MQSHHNIEGYNYSLLLKMLPRIYKRYYFYTLLLLLVCFLFSKYFSESLEDDPEYYEVDNLNSSFPTIMWWTETVPFKRTITCDDNIKCNVVDPSLEDRNIVSAYLFYGSSIENLYSLPVPRKPEVLWALFHEESPRNVEQLMHEEILQLFNYSATFSRYSDVPFPLHYVNKELITSTKLFLPTSEKNKLLGDIAPVLFIQSDCNTATERDDYMLELMNHIDVDCYGSCLNNKEQPASIKTDYLNNLYSDDFLKFTAQYKFVIAIENGVCHDYITEKLWRPIFAGSVPIYFGSPTVLDWLPNPKSAILLKDHPNPKIMANYLKKLLQNDTLYEEYLDHKLKGKITNELLLKEMDRDDFSTEFDKLVKSFECFMCKKSYEKLNGTLKPRSINKLHYNCPEPVSALTLKVNQYNTWVYSWANSKNVDVKEFLKWYQSKNSNVGTIDLK